MQLLDNTFQKTPRNSIEVFHYLGNVLLSSVILTYLYITYVLHYNPYA